MTKPDSSPKPNSKLKHPGTRSGRRAPAPTPLAHHRLRALGFISPKHTWMTGNLGRELGAINHETLEACGEPVTCASGYELLCSYNWARPRQRTPPRDPDPDAQARWRAMPRVPQIFVPGEAPRLVPRRLPFITGGPSSWYWQRRLANYRDVNVAMLPRCPFEPLFRAVGFMRPGFRFDEVDVVVNRSSLSALLRIGEWVAVLTVFIPKPKSCF